MGNMMKWVCVEFPSSGASRIAFTDPVTLFWMLRASQTNTYLRNWETD